jgi:hypothetical protein
VWEDHLLPLLANMNAARLGSSCKALRDLVREHFKYLSPIKVWKLERGALTTFPRARAVEVQVDVDIAGGEEAMVQWLCEGGRGRYLEGLMEKDLCTRDPDLPYDPRLQGVFSQAVHGALQQGALPSLKKCDVFLIHPRQRASLEQGFTRAMQELRLNIDFHGEAVDVEHQLAALSLVRQLPALAKLELCVKAAGDDVNPLLWPPFISRSLKALRLDLEGFWGLRASESLMRALPGTLGASGATLDRLQVLLPSRFDHLGDGLIHLAKALRCCSPTLKDFRLSTTSEDALCDLDTSLHNTVNDAGRLYDHWTELLAGVSACRELQVLVLRAVMVESVFPSSTAFDRLTHLEINESERERPPEAGRLGLLELMASGRLPALAKLSVEVGWWRWGAEEVRTRVAPAFEAVAGTLTHLFLITADTDGLVWNEDAAYELGVALGRLRRLQDLALGLFEEGPLYRAVAQGLAVSGGDRPLPLLWRMTVASYCVGDPELVVCLLLPSVRVFITKYANPQSAVLTACAVRQAGYKHTWGMWCPRWNDTERRRSEIRGPVRSIVRGCRWEMALPSWVVLPTDFSEASGEPED